jgi:adenosylmethionine-8-amino-7-oxononanoate aminotransferase
MMQTLGLRRVDSGENTRILGDFNAQYTATDQQGLTGHHTTLGFMAHDVQLTRIQLFCWPNDLFPPPPPPAILHGNEWDESDIYEFQQININRLDEITVVILEPIVQCAGGRRFYSPQYLKRVQELCDDYDVLLICDKIATGFGWTGKIIAVEHAKDVAPDIMCIGKALSGGFLSFAVTLTSQHIAKVFSQAGALRES